MRKHTKRDLVMYENCIMHNQEARHTCSAVATCQCTQVLNARHPPLPQQHVSILYRERAHARAKDRESKKQGARRKPAVVGQQQRRIDFHHAHLCTSEVWTLVHYSGCWVRLKKIDIVMHEYTQIHVYTLIDIIHNTQEYIYMFVRVSSTQDFICRNYLAKQKHRQRQRQPNTSFKM
jgi:hypothetical protein